MKNLLAALAVLAAAVATLPAQDTRKVAFRTLCLEQVKDLETVRLVSADESKEDPEIQLYTDISGVTEGTFKGGQALFCTEKPGPDGKPVRTIVGKTALTKSSRQLFVFMPGPGGAGKLPYHIFAYDDDLRSFPLGNVRAINLAPVPVRFILSGATTPAIAPGKTVYFPHSKKTDEYNTYPVVTEFQSAGGEWVKGQSTSWKSAARRRDIVVTRVDMTYKQPAVQFYSDFPSWKDQ